MASEYWKILIPKTWMTVLWILSQPFHFTGEMNGKWGRTENAIKHKAYVFRIKAASSEMLFHGCVFLLFSFIELYRDEPFIIRWLLCYTVMKTRVRYWKEFAYQYFKRPLRAHIFETNIVYCSWVFIGYKCYKTNISTVFQMIPFVSLANIPYSQNQYLERNLSALHAIPMTMNP